MPRDRQPAAGACPQCHESAVVCFHNHFADARKTIDSWEHRCENCGHRETRAVRSDEPSTQDVPGDVCPFCGRTSPAA